jgi:hypothetical protein
MRGLIFGDVSTWNIDNFKVSNINNSIFKKIKKADFVIYNLEGPIRLENKKYKELEIRRNPIKNILIKIILSINNRVSGMDQKIAFSNLKILDLLKINKNTIVTLANNHVKDLGIEGFSDTLKLLDKNKINFLGAGFNLGDANKELNINNEYTTINYNYVAASKKGIYLGIHNAQKRDYGGAYLSFEKIKRKVADIKKHKKKSILILHMGKELTSGENLGIDFEKIKSINANITIIHHPHAYVKTEYEKENIFILGDFVFKSNHLPSNRQSAFLGISGNAKLSKFKIDKAYNYE